MSTGHRGSTGLQGAPSVLAPAWDAPGRVFVRDSALSQPSGAYGRAIAASSCRGPTGVRHPGCSGKADACTRSFPGGNPSVRATEGPHFPDGVLMDVVELRPQDPSGSPLGIPHKASLLQAAGALNMRAVSHWSSSPTHHGLLPGPGVPRVRPAVGRGSSRGLLPVGRPPRGTWVQPTRREGHLCWYQPRVPEKGQREGRGQASVHVGPVCTIVRGSREATGDRVCLTLWPASPGFLEPGVHAERPPVLLGAPCLGDIPSSPARLGDLCPWICAGASPGTRMRGQVSAAGRPQGSVRIMLRVAILGPQRGADRQTGGSVSVTEATYKGRGGGEGTGLRTSGVCVSCVSSPPWLLRPGRHCPASRRPCV